MKLLFVASCLNVGGMERVLVDLANALVERDHDVTLVTYDLPAEENFESELDKRVRFIYKPPKEFKLMKKLPYFHKKYRPGKWETRTSARSLYGYYIGGREKYDAEIAFCRGPAVKIISGSTNKRSKKITWVHNDYTLVDPKTITKYFENMDDAKAAYSKFDAIAAVSEEARQKFIEVIGYEEKTTVIYNMLDIGAILKKSKEDCPLQKKAFTVISVARIIPAKGYDTLLRAVKRLKDDGLNFELWLVGNRFGGEYDESLDKYVADNGLDNVIFTGRQLNPYCFMAQADVYICSSWREGFSISTAEAMACGLPVISTNCTGPAEILEGGKNGILIRYDEDEMYAALKKVIEDPAILDKYRERSVERAKDFSSGRITDQIVSLFMK